MEAALRKLLGPGVTSLDIAPAFPGGGDLHIARVEFEKNAPALRLTLGQDGIHAVGFRRREDGTVGGKIHFHASELPAASVDASAKVSAKQSA